MRKRISRNALSVAVALLAAQATQAQTASSAGDTSARQPTNTLTEITVTGNPLGSADLSQSSTRLSGDALLQRSQSTLGETLNGLPGVSSTYFGPNASRPTIRGQDGDRIRVLNNGGAMQDVSALSYDHSVPTDALIAERVEVLRGPAALSYGGSAVGGVVNIIDNRIPSKPINGLTGRADLGWARGSNEKSGAVLLEGGNERFALHADAFGRRSDDLRVPLSLPCTQPGAPALQQRICNSAARSDGGALGGTLFFDQGWIGASVDDYRSLYGTVAEDEVTIDMHSRHYALAGEWRPGASGLGQYVSALSLKAQHSNYRHNELEGPELGTVFSQRGSDWRLQVRQRPIASLGGLEGVLGLTHADTRFAAVGEEAFAPPSRTRATALFVQQELPAAWGRLSVGARTERVSVRSLGVTDPEGEPSRFAVGERSFNPHSLAMGALYKLSPHWRLTGNLAYTERAPKDYEMLANGPHLATAAWEVGDPTLQKEKSIGGDLGAEWNAGPHRANVNLYWSRFRNYIGLHPTGQQRGDAPAEEGEHEGEEAHAEEESAHHDALLAEYVYRGVRARFTGLEAHGSLRLRGADALMGASGAGTLDLEWRADVVRASNLDDGQPLPRIAPLRAGATLVWKQGSWSARAGFDAYAAQKRVPLLDRPTSGYTLWNAGLSYRMEAGPASLLWYLRLDNLSNRLAYSASSILTSTAFPKAPLPGRSVKVGLRVDF